MSVRRTPCAMALFAVMACAVLLCGCEDKKDKILFMRPGQAQNPQPAGGIADVPVTTSLSWDAASLAGSYDVYFGTVQAAVESATAASSEFRGNITATSFDPSPVGSLSYGATYYWRVDSANAYGTTTGLLWSFTTEPAPATPPDQVASPAPPDGAADVPIDQILSWAAAARAESYDVYLGATLLSVQNATTASAEFMENTTNLSYDPAGLDYATTYYWRIDSVNSVDTTKGDVWDLTTETAALPDKATAPVPSDSASDVPITQVLSWAAGAGAESYDVYLGTDQAAVDAATTASTQFMENTTGLSYDPVSLDYSITYYWRIDSVNTGGTTKGDVWQFTTEAAPVIPPEVVASPVPSDTATDIPTNQVLSWAAATGAESYDVYLGTVEADVDNATTTDPEHKTNTTGLSYDPAGLNPSITYYWRVDSLNIAGTTKGDVWSFTIAAAPIADFTGTPIDGQPPLTVAFSDASTGIVTSWEWDFDNDSVFDAFTQDATCIYSTSGLYAVKLKVTGPGGIDECVKIDYITVYTPPEADFTGTPTFGGAPLTVSFSDTSTGLVTFWAWDFDNDGFTDAFTQDATHIYPDAGPYTVKLSVGGPGGTDDMVKIDYITVYVPPEADFTATPTIGTSPLTVSFSDASTGVITTWDWDFDNDGVTDSTAQDATFIYNDLGFYTVKLKVSGPGGEDAQTKTKLIQVVDGLVITTLRLPYAQMNVAYSQTLEAYGGAPLYTWVAASSPPDGLILNPLTGEISGIPTGARPSFNAVVTDSLAASATQLLAIRVDGLDTVHITVAKDGSADFTTITDALASLPDPLLVPYVIEIIDSGTYIENLTFSTTGSRISLRSAYNQLATIEAADPDTDVITIDAMGVTVERLRICGASGAGKAGVKLESGFMLMVRNCIIFNNDIAIDAGNQFGVQFAANTCYGPKGISSSGGGSAQVFNNLIYSTGGPTDWCLLSTFCTAGYNLYYAPASNVGYNGTIYYPTMADCPLWMVPNCQEGNPNLKDVSACDFHLTDSSLLAIDLGGIVFGNPIILDAEGFARPQGVAMDIGAYEHK